MDLRFSAEDEQYRLKLRTWLEANMPTEAPPSDQDADFAFPARLAAQALRRRLDRHQLAQGIRRPRRHAD